MNIRFGYGEDIHQLVKGRPLILGGINIPFEKGLLGHSDADVLLHTISDALLGALALGDIGKIFPPSDPKTLNIDSSIILNKCYELVKNEGYVLNNLDASVSLEKPHLSEYIPQIRKRIASLLMVDISQISIKAMTNEGLDAVGEEKAIRATCVVSIIKE